MIKYSVIIPVYNSEKTIARCLNSLTVQNREDVQIIVVNDGSTDSSEAIIKDFAERYPQILYIYQENAGVSQARNAGLALAEGTYITFLDSDDYVTPNYFAQLDTAEDCDLLVFAHEYVGGVPVNDAALFAELQHLETFDARLILLLASRKIMSPCNKRFRNEIIQRNYLHFVSNMHIGEDFNFCMAYTLYCCSIETTSDPLLCVDLSDQTSLSRKYRPRLDLQMLDVFNNIEQTIQASPQGNELKERLLAVADYLFVKNTFSCISEEFKQRKLSYWKNRTQITAICDTFQKEFSKKRVNSIHKALRIALGAKIYWPFYLVTYWVKGRKYHH